MLMHAPAVPPVLGERTFPERGAESFLYRFNTTSLPTDVQEALINEPAKRGPHLPQRGGVPASGRRAVSLCLQGEYHRRTSASLSWPVTSSTLARCTSSPATVWAKRSSNAVLLSASSAVQSPLWRILCSRWARWRVG